MQPLHTIVNELGVELVDLGISEKVKPILEEVKNFIDIEILPLEAEYHQEVEKLSLIHISEPTRPY